MPKTNSLLRFRGRVSASADIRENGIDYAMAFFAAAGQFEHDDYLKGYLEILKRNKP